MGRGNESLFEASWSHGQDGRHPIYGKNPSKIFSGTSGPSSTKLGIPRNLACSSGDSYPSLFLQMMTMG